MPVNMLLCGIHRSGKNAINRNAVRQLGRDVETFLEIQHSRIRRPGAGRDPVTLKIFKSLGPGLRRDDEHFGTSASSVKTFPGQQCA